MSTAITYKAQGYYGEPETMHSWTILDGDQVIAELYADLVTGQIMNVRTVAGRRGEGIATALYAAASSQIDLYHSPDEHCTPEGLAFKQSVGGDTIADDLAYAA